MRVRHLVLTLAILGSIPAGPAHAATCVEGPPSVLVVTAAPEEVVVLSVGPGGEIDVNDVPCGTATTTSIDTIEVVGSAGTAEIARVDLSGGAFAPGVSAEFPGVPEIEIDVTLEDDPGDVVEVLGTAGDDVLRAAAGGIELTDDDDLDLTSSGAVASVDGAAGNDTIRGDGAAGSGPADARLLLGGGEGNDLLAGGSGNDVMGGGPGDDTLEGSPGDDVLGGGEGGDLASFAGAPDSVTASLSAGTAEGWGADRLLQVEHLTGSSSPDRLFGDEVPNVIVGGSGRDRITGDRSPDLLIGQRGRDFFRPGAGADRVIGGEGQDTLTLRSAPRRARINLGAGDAFGDGHDRLQSIESAVGSRRDDLLVGSNVRNHRLVGTRGDDVILGLGGDDRLRGGPGDDELEGGPGDDELDGGQGRDVLRGGPGRDRLKVSPGHDRRIG